MSLWQPIYFLYHYQQYIENQTITGQKKEGVSK